MDPTLPQTINSVTNSTENLNFDIINFLNSLIPQVRTFGMPGVITLIQFFIIIKYSPIVISFLQTIIYSLKLKTEKNQKEILSDDQINKQNIDVENIQEMDIPQIINHDFFIRRIQDWKIIQVHCNIDCKIKKQIFSDILIFIIEHWETNLKYIQEHFYDEEYYLKKKSSSYSTIYQNLIIKNIRKQRLETYNYIKLLQDQGVLTSEIVFFLKDKYFSMVDDQLIVIDKIWSNNLYINNYTKFVQILDIITFIFIRTVEHIDIVINDINGELSQITYKGIDYIQCNCKDCNIYQESIKKRKI